MPLIRPTQAHPFQERPVMYLDVDDTLLTYNSGLWEATYGRIAPSLLSGNEIIAAPGAGEFF